MNDKLITHADLDAIKVIEGECANLTCSGEAAELLRRLRAAAEADAPPLPERVVIDLSRWPHSTAEDWRNEASILTKQRPDALAAAELCLALADAIDAANPLRPAVTESDVGRAVEAAWKSNVGALELDAANKRHLTAQMRAAFEAAGVEVQP